MKLRKIILMLSLISLAACFKKPLPKVDEIEILPEELNNRISLTAPTGWNDFKIGSEVVISIVNVSNDMIIFEPNYGIRIFLYDEEGEWIEVEDQLTDLNTDDIILRPIKIDPTATGTTVIRPKLVSEAKELTLRVYVVGYVYKDHKKTQEKTGAFIDIVLKK